MIPDKKLANAVAGKTARACDGCIGKRARFYCAADDAFLCQACDASVHSANPLARRHERVRLKMASSFKRSEEDEYQENCVPTWHHGFTKKPRTPRHGKHYNSKPKSSEDQPLLDLFNTVPEICSDEASLEDNEDQLLYRVPILDPFVAELCTTPNPNEGRMAILNHEAESSDAVTGNESKKALLHDVKSLHGFLPSEMDLAEFAADVQTLLGKGLEVESFDMDRLGLFDCKDEKLQEGCLGSGRVKVEEEEEEAAAFMADQFDTEIDVMTEPFELNLDDYHSPVTCEDDEKIGQMDMIASKDEEFKENMIKKKKISLRLDYEGVLTAWADQRSPWTTGQRPEVDLNENDWPYFMGTCGTLHQPYTVMGLIGGGQTTVMDWGREARVSRYRVKRMTRQFSKKVRYEVRKLNAEKRPRMKGRFVKRAKFAAPAAFPLLNK